MCLCVYGCGCMCWLCMMGVLVSKCVCVGVYVGVCMGVFVCVSVCVSVRV